MIMYYAFGNHIYTFSSVPHKYSFFCRHISFSVFMQINFNILHTYVSIYNTNAYYVLSDCHKYFYLVAIFVLSYLWSLIFSLKDKLPGITFCMWGCMYMSAHTHIHSCSSAYIHSSMHTYIHVCLHPSIHTYTQTHVCMSTYIYTDM